MTTKPINYVLSVAGIDGILKPLSSAMEIDPYALTDQINRIAKALSIVGFRGTSIFQIATETGNLVWTTTITFTDDIPTGVWNTTNHHFNGQ